MASGTYHAHEPKKYFGLTRDRVIGRSNVDRQGLRSGPIILGDQFPE